VAYAVRITRIGFDETSALYEWESTKGPKGHVRIEFPSVVFRPADAEGTPIGAMMFRKGDADVTNPEPGAVSSFVTVVSGILKKWKDDEPPETAHLYFG